MYVLFYICVWADFVDLVWVYTCTWEEFWSVCLFLTEFDRSEVALFGLQDVNIDTY